MKEGRGRDDKKGRFTVGEEKNFSREIYDMKSTDIVRGKNITL